MSRRLLSNAEVVLALLLAVSVAGCERAKTKLDREVDRLCAIDGGVHIYETVTLPKENFGPDGEVFPQYRARYPNGELGPGYSYRRAESSLVQGDPALQRFHHLIVRLNDQKTLGELVVYRRSGGDLAGPWQPSTYSCPLGPKFDLERKVFVSAKE